MPAAANMLAPDPEPPVFRARAIVNGAMGSGIAGIVKLTQTRKGIVSEVMVEAQFTGLQPGSVHGMHIHEVGSCSNTDPVTSAAGAFLGAGGHFDPGPNSNPAADANHPFHMGDMPNVVANEIGVGTLKHTTSRVTLSPGPLSVFDANGSAIILHVNADQGTTGVTGGAGGARLACGVIERVDTPASN
jgi:Cu-Zn family superoxide dismutase